MKGRQFSQSIFAFSMVLVMILVAGCGAAQTPAGDAEPTEDAMAAPELDRDPDTLIFSIYSNPQDFDPASSSDAASNIVLNQVYEGLVRAKPENYQEYQPQLAERWESNDDWTVWTFYLRENATFHDGTSVNAEAVKFSFTRLINLNLGLGYILGQFIFEPESQIVVVDEYTIEFRFDYPTPLLLPALSCQYGSYVISPKAIQDNEVDGDMAHAWLQTHAVGSGSYKLTEYSPNEQIVFTANEDWWGWDEGFHFEEAVIKIIPESSTARTLLEKGDIDGAYGLNIEDWAVLQELPHVQGHINSGMSIQAIEMGSYGPLADPRARQGLSYAFDYDGWLNGVWKGLADRARGPIAPNLKCHDPDTFTYELDLEKAKELLDAAGVTEGTELRYMTIEGLDNGAGEILQAQLAKIGIKLTIIERDNATFFSTFFSDIEWPERPEMFFMIWWPDFNDPTAMTWVNFHTDAWGSSGGNAGFYSNAEADAIIDASYTTYDDEELCASYVRYQEIVTKEDPPWIYTHVDPDNMFLLNGIKGYVFNPVYRPMLWFRMLYREGY